MCCTVNVLHGEARLGWRWFSAAKTEKMAVYGGLQEAIYQRKSNFRICFYSLKRPMSRPMDSAPRIVSLLASATEILYGLGLADQTVAVSHECDYPPACRDKPQVTLSKIDSAVSSLHIDNQVQARVATRESLYAVDESKLIALQPDMIVTQDQCDVCAVSLDQVRQLVASADALSETSIVALNPQSLADVFADIRRLAKLTNTEQAAEDWLGDLQARVTTIRAKTDPLAATERPRVICIEWIEPLMIAGNWTPELLSWAGGVAGLATEGEHSQYHDWSEVLDFDPEVIIVAPCGFDLRRSQSEAEALKQLRNWHNITAQRQDRVFVLDGNAYLNRSGPRLVETLEILASVIQPQFFPTAPTTSIHPLH